MKSFDAIHTSVRQTVHDIMGHFLFGEGHFLLQSGRGLSLQLVSIGHLSTHGKFRDGTMLQTGDIAV